MILREWRGRAALSRPEAYPAHFHTIVMPDLQRTPGFLGAQLLRRQLGDAIEFVVVTRWESLESIRAFAGEAIDQAFVEPGGAAALMNYDLTVTHYDVIAEA